MFGNGDELPAATVLVWQISYTPAIPSVRVCGCPRVRAGSRLDGTSNPSGRAGGRG